MAFDSSKNWHYVKNGEAAGPVPGPELTRLVTDGSIRANTLIWNPTLPNWVEAGTFAELFPSAPVPPPIPMGGAPQPVFAALSDPAPAPSISPLADFGPDLGAARPGASGGWTNESLEPASDTPYEADVEPRYAGFWIRVVAYIIDIIIVGAIYWAVVQFTTLDEELRPFMNSLIPIDQIDLAIAMAEQQGITAFNRTMFQEIAATSVISGVITTLYFVLLHWILQATLGKLVVGIRLAKTNGDNIGFFRSLWRYLMTFISAAIAMIGYLLVAFTPQKTALHDLLAGTRVVYRKP